MIALTYFPPLWRKVMDHRVLEHYDGDITRVNIQPRVRDKVLAKYGAQAHERLPLPGLRLRLRRSERRSAGRLSGGHGLGAMFPTTGAAPTAECARRSTSKR